MRRYLLVFLAILFPATAQAEQFSGKPRIVNGYTLEVAGTQVVLWGINAPNKEETCPSSKDKPVTCGIVAKRTLGILIQGNSITCETKGKSATGLPTAVCKLDRFDVAEQLVMTGWAVAYPVESKRYLYPQKTAKITKSGMWKSKKFKPEDIQGRK